MTADTERALPSGHAVFARYAYPPNELGYCGPADANFLLRGDDAARIASHAKDFDGAWPYLQAIADAVNVADPLDEQIVRSYWVGGPLLDRVDAEALLLRLRKSFVGQVTGLLDDPNLHGALAHHSFHVFVVYPWMKFLDRSPTTPLNVMQECRIRWGTIESVHGDHAEMLSPPLTYESGRLAVGEPVTERVRWRKDGASLAPAPSVGQTVAAHWGWLCGDLSDVERADLEAATRSTLEVVNAARGRS